MDKSTFGGRVNTLCRIGEHDRLLCALDSLIGVLPEVKTRRDVAKFLIMNKQYGINIGTFARTYINMDPGARPIIEEVVSVRNDVEKYHYIVHTEFWTDKDTETFLKEREVLDEINKLTWTFVEEDVEKLRPILQKLEDMYPGIDAAKYVKLHTSGPIHDLVSKIIETSNTHYGLDTKVLSIIKSDVSMESKANSFCDILEEIQSSNPELDSPDKEYVESVLTELLHRDCLDKSYDCQHLLIQYKSLHPEAETANEAAKLILDRLSGYDRYYFGEIYAEYVRSVGMEGYDILKEEESLAQQVIGMFPPSLAKEYQDNNKIMWALKLALHNK